MKKRNDKIRESLKKNKFPLWYLGQILDHSESYVTRMMRNELPEDEQIRIVKLIETAAKETKA